MHWRCHVPYIFYDQCWERVLVLSRAVARLSVVGGQRGAIENNFLNFEKNLQNKIRKFLINSQ